MAKKSLKITVNGKEYPSRQSMGALVRFKRETGKEVNEIAENDIVEMCTLLYCCTVSACHADKVPFDMDMQEFADGLAIEDMNAWVLEFKEAALEAAAKMTDADEKKRTRRPPKN